ncbi:MAG: HupE/UreJ family protein [Flavisolibacter sp.]|nr:HupE/UreJ family protein [Flavisolibacter sp.]
MFPRFGLIHRLAFATVLSNLDLSAGKLALSILGFNLGIEVMQLFVVAITIPWLILLSKKSAYRFVRTGGALFAAIAAIAWIIQSSAGEANSLPTLVEGISANARWIVFGLALLSISSSFWPKRKKPVLENAFISEQDKFMQ